MPVFMVVSQSAATSACLAVDEGTAVQRVVYARLQARLMQDGQVLHWPPNLDLRLNDRRKSINERRMWMPASSKIAGMGWLAWCFPLYSDT